MLSLVRAHGHAQEAQPLSARLQGGLRFLRPPLPVAPSPSLTVRIPHEVGYNGLTQLTTVELRASPVGARLPVGTMDVAACRLLRQSAPRTFWSRPPASWAVSNSREGFALCFCSTLWRFSRPLLL